jgi:hypothetical protein
MTIITGKHRELLIELLIHYLDNTRERLWEVDPIINYIKERDSDGDWYINHYIDKWNKRTNYYEPQHNNPEHTDEENNDNG